MSVDMILIEKIKVKGRKKIFCVDIKNTKLYFDYVDEETMLSF